MDRIGFRSMLEQRRLPEEVIEASLAMAERFEDFLVGKPASADTAWAFSKSLIEEGKNTEQNYLALIRYCLFINKPAMYVALLELVDGGEVSDNLYRKIGESYGQAVRDEVFAGIGIAPYGTPTPEKPAFIHPVIGKLEMKVGEQKCADFLSASLRDLPEEHFRGERNKYLQAGGIDAYLAQRKEAFVLELEKCLREGRPFYAQEVTREVIAYIKSQPEMGGGQRVDGIVYETKIPYMTRAYLTENDPIMKRYYYCHCPWVREAIKNGGVRLAATFCNCSAGFHKKPFEAAFGCPVKVEVLESALRGDLCCRFAIHLPAEAIVPKPAGGRMD
jgi:hypothetical protein